MKPASPVLAAALLLIGSLACADDGRVFMMRGPRLGKGLPFFGPNAIAHEQADYGYNGGVVTVYFVRGFPPPPAGWERRDCGRAAFLTPPGAGKVFLHSGGDEWYILFVFRPDEDESCPFMVPFLERLRFFLATVRSSGSPLPAVIDLK